MEAEKYYWKYFLELPHRTEKKNFQISTVHGRYESKV